MIRACRPFDLAKRRFVQEFAKVKIIPAQTIIQILADPISGHAASAMVNRFLQNIELWLSVAGLLVVWGASVLIAPGDVDIWKVAALTALAISMLHGLIFWMVRRRQRHVRQQAIAEIKEMLADVVKNQLSVMGLWLQISDNDGLKAELTGITDSIDNITNMVNDLSEESLRSWKVKYKEAVENATDLGPVDTEPRPAKRRREHGGSSVSSRTSTQG
jgi:hypothetical protein